jgi:hypothetical protein
MAWCNAWRCLGAPGPEALATIKIVCDAPKNSEAVGSSNANSLCGGEFGWTTGNLCDLSKGYFATTFLSSSLTCPATQSINRSICHSSSLKTTSRLLQPAPFPRIRPHAKPSAEPVTSASPGMSRAVLGPKLSSMRRAASGGQRQGGHLRPIGDFDDRHLYVSQDRSRDDQSDHFIEHSRRCGSAAKDRLKPTIVAGFVVIPQQRKTFLHRAR